MDYANGQGVRKGDKLIGLRLRTARTDRRLSQEDTAGALGVRPATISQWETGTSKVSVSRLKQLAALYDVSLPWLLGHTDEGDAAEYMRAVIRRLEQVPADRRQLVAQMAADYILFLTQQGENA